MSRFIAFRFGGGGWDGGGCDGVCSGCIEGGCFWCVKWLCCVFCVVRKYRVVNREEKEGLEEYRKEIVQGI